MCSRLGVQHRLRAPEAHVDAIELEHKHVMGAARAAIAAARGATARDWEDAALDAIDKSNLRVRGDRGDIPHRVLAR